MVQTAGVQGDHNTVVQIDGNGNTVVLGQPHLRLTRFEVERNKPLTDARLLIPARRAIPLFGRDDELKSLLDFVRPDAPPDIRVRVLVGSGGSGKTRLALELCDQINDRWLAGFVTTDALDKFFKQQDAGSWGWQKPTLMVLDYAAAQAEVLRKWLPELLDRTTPPTHPLRILLLERHADPHSGWHERVFNPGGWQNAGLRDLLDPPEPIRIRPLFEVSDRMGVLRAVLQLVAPALVPLLTSDLLEAQFQNTSWGGDPLYLAMAALTMARRGDVSALQLGRTDLALEVAGHEMQRLAQAAESKGLERELVLHLAACITLLQGLPRIEALGLIRTEKQAIGLEQGDTAKLVDVLHECLPAGERIAGVEPDLIGEALLLRAWSKPERAGAIARLFADHSLRVTETLVRVVQDFSQTDPKPKTWFAALLKGCWDDPAALWQIDAVMPSNSVALSDVNLQLVQRLRALDADPAPEAQAKHWTRLFGALTNAGQRDAALAAAQQAANLCQGLARQLSGAYTPNWAMSLNNLANAHDAVGQSGRGLVFAKKAADLYSNLARTHPGAYTASFAHTATTLAHLHATEGQHQEALAVARKAEQLWSDLADKLPEVHLPDWALSLSNLARMLKGVNLQEEGLEVAAKAVDLFHGLASVRPDAHRSDLAMALNNYAAILIDAGHRERATEVAKLAIRLREELAHQHPQLYAADLAHSMMLLADIHTRCGRKMEAVDQAHEALLALRRPYLTAPRVYVRQMLFTMENYLRFCQAAGSKADMLLLSPLMNHLHSLAQEPRSD